MSLTPPTGSPLTSDGTTQPIVKAKEPMVVGGALNPTATNALKYSQLVPCKNCLLQAPVLARRAKSLRGFRMFAR